MIDKLTKAEKLLGRAHAELRQALEETTGRRRGPIIQKLHQLQRMSNETPPHFSQSGQDRVVDRLLNNKTGGIFVDVGGYDGVDGSNTLFFELFRQWSGILVEASVTQLEKARAVRRCPCLGCAVAGEEGQATFLEVTTGYTQMSGVLETYAPIRLNHVRSNPSHSENLYTLEKHTLARILDDQGLTTVDYLSLDVEGGELQVLQSFPFERFQVELWSIENNAQGGEIPALMRAHGYTIVEYAGVDDIYRKTTDAP